VQSRRFFRERRRFIAASARAAAPFLGRLAVAGGVLGVLALACRQRFAFPDDPQSVWGAGTRDSLAFFPAESQYLQ
jgi:hypothetical protein